MRDDAGPEIPDVVPPAVLQCLAAAWIILFSGRWILVHFLLASGLLSPAQLAVLDDPILLRVYLALLCVTLLIVVLRAVRGALMKLYPRSIRQGSPADPEPSDGSSTRAAQESQTP